MALMHWRSLALSVAAPDLGREVVPLGGTSARSVAILYIVQFIFLDFLFPQSFLKTDFALHFPLFNHSVQI